MQHCPARAAQRLAAAVLALCLVLALAVPHAHAAALQETHGIRMLDFSTSQILSIGNQTSGKCSWYALRYARTILDGKVSSGSGMWSNGAVWSAGGYTGRRLLWLFRQPVRVPAEALHRAFRREAGDRASEKHCGERCKTAHEPHLQL